MTKLAQITVVLAAILLIFSLAAVAQTGSDSNVNDTRDSSGSSDDDSDSDNSGSSDDSRDSSGSSIDGLIQADDSIEESSDTAKTRIRSLIDERDDGEVRIRTEVRQKEIIRDDSGKIIGEREVRQRTETRFNKDDILGREIFTKLKFEEKTKFRKLSGEKLDRISKLSSESVTKVKGIRSDRLRVLAAHDLEKITQFRQNDIEKLAVLDRSRIKEISDLSPDAARRKLDRIRIVKADEDFKFRPLELEKIKTVARSLNVLQANEEKLRIKYEERLERLREVKDRVRACRESEDIENCSSLDDEARSHSKEAALNAVERVVNHLEKAKNRLESSQDLSEERVAEGIARLDALLAKVADIKLAIEATNNKEELNSAVRELKSLIKEIKEKSKETAHNIIRAQTTGIIHRSEIIEKKLDCSLNSLEEQDIDTSTIDDKVDAASELIGDARSKVKEARETFDEKDDTAIAAAKTLLTEARDSVKEAQAVLVDVRKDILDLGGSICTEQQEVAIEDDADEDEDDEQEAVNASDEE